ncbi:MAG: hypothetical protein CL678_00990 [Bdellovibrionaceae bacterium]|nr:hypothetical protein [Pseudobdellovibrionaceae bacterium]|tara:strand:+ start:2830 stop:3261 length:432 start_codon:yes stop_codon:yes gene_type:complete
MGTIVSTDMARIKATPVKNKTKTENNALVPAKGKRGRHWRSKWKREIIRQQRSTDLTTVGKAPMRRLIREIADKLTSTSGLRWNADAMTMVHVEGESYITEIFERAVENCVHAKRQTIRVTDLQLALQNYNREQQRLQSLCTA